jgi:alpha-beta hydrolase superfamily lysophospholipase
MNHRTILLVLLSSLFCSCVYFRDENVQPDTTGFDQAQVKQDMTELDITKPYTPTPAIRDYFNFYSLNPTNAQHYFGTIESKSEVLAAHVFIPLEPRGTLFLIHGYFDHTGTLARLIAAALEENYAVVSWDLPGHGLSSGDRTDTGQFSLCAEQFIDIVQRSAEHLPQPIHLVAHSTGSSIAIEYMHNPDPDVFSKMVFLAPLVRHAHWGWGKFGYAISNPFVNKVRRREKTNSTDEAYLAFVKKDPLHSAVLSYDYLGDLYAWEKQVRKYPVWPESVCIIQGDKDTVVSWKYNTKFLETKFETTELHLIHGAKHQLVNESDNYRNQVFELIFNYLEQKSAR